MDIDGKPVTLYTLSNRNGLTMQVTNWGARVVSLWIPDRQGNWDDIVLGYETIDRYLGSHVVWGATVGRFGNRIANGCFSLNGETYQLSTSDNGQCLHGGDKGFDRVVWDVDSVATDCIFFSYYSKNGEEGFPGNLYIKMIYRLTSTDEFRIDYTAVTDKSTPVNLTHHSLFNLKGEGNGSVESHRLCIAAGYYTPVDSVWIPTGELAPVAGTPFDFRSPVAVGEQLKHSDAQLEQCRGFDHNFVLDRKTSDELEWVASLYEPSNGRYMEIWTTEPGIQFYSGNLLDGSIKGKSGKEYGRYGALALETQHFPDSPNQSAFPSTILNPGEFYHQVCIYRFGVK
nr:MULTISPECIES: aldose epimerase family protein [Bacteroides]